MFPKPPHSQSLRPRCVEDSPLVGQGESVEGNNMVGGVRAHIPFCGALPESERKGGITYWANYLLFITGPPFPVNEGYNANHNIANRERIFGRGISRCGSRRPAYRNIIQCSDDCRGPENRGPVLGRFPRRRERGKEGGEACLVTLIGETNPVST